MPQYQGTAEQRAQDIRDAAILANIAYSDNPGAELGNRWRLVGEYDNLNAQAIVAQNGATLSIAFRGTDTDEPLDFWTDVSAGLVDFDAHYELFRGLITAVHDYAADPNNNVDRILVAGHSLGAAMVEFFMAEFSDTNAITYSGVSFGSPGVMGVTSSPGFDTRTFNIGHSEDPFWGITPNSNVEGVDIVVDLPHLNGLPSFEEHNGSNYQLTANLITASSNLFDRFNATPTAFSVTILDAGNFTGSDGSDYIIGGIDSARMWGGGGVDLIYGFSGNDFIFGEAGNDWLDGGRGNDLLRGDAGRDRLWGGADNDTFHLGNGLPAPSHIDEINDYRTGNTGSYDATEMDVIDISGMLGPTFDPATSDITDFVRAVADPYSPTGRILLQVNPDGSGGTYGWNTVASLNSLPPGAEIDLALGTGIAGTVTVPAVHGSWEISPATTSTTEVDGQVITFTVTRPDATDPATVYISTTQVFGSANNGDYDGLLNVPRTFSAGQTQITVDVTIRGDTTPEDVEQFGLIVQSSPNHSISQRLAAATFTINDDDVSPGNLDPNFSSGDDWVWITPDFSTQTSYDAGAGHDHVTLDFSGFSEAVSAISRSATNFEARLSTTSPNSSEFRVSNAERFTLLGGSGDDHFITSRSGNDVLFGGGGNDYLSAGDGNDALSGGDGNDSLFGGGGVNVLDGGAGDDYFEFTEGGRGAIDGGSGVDRLNVFPSNATAAFNFTFDGGASGALILQDGTSITGVELLDFNSGSGDDDITYDFGTAFAGRQSLGMGGGHDHVTLDFSGFSEAVIATGDSATNFDARLSTTSYRSPEFWVGDAERFTLLGGSGDDIFRTTNTIGNDVLFGGGGNDNLSAGDGNDALSGGDGDDSLYGGDGIDALDGGAGDDHLEVGEGGPDAIDGGSGLDRLYLDRSSATTAFNFTFDVGGASSALTLQDGTTIAGVELLTFTSGSGDDDITYDFGTAFAGRQSLGMRGGHDHVTLDFSGFSEAVRAYDNNPASFQARLSTTSYRSPELEVSDAERFTLLGGSGDDIFRTTNTIGNDVLFGGGGNDNLSAGDGNDALSGGDGDDSLYGGDGIDALDGGAGDDLIFGSNGNDTITGGAGNDDIRGGNHNDSLDGGSGHDTLNGGIREDSLSGGEGEDSLFGGAGFDSLWGNQGDDTLRGGGQADNLFGGIGNDSMYGDQGFDRLFGGLGDDLGYGGSGSDGVFGQQGNDRLFGQIGDDRIFGGQGNDRIDGGHDDDVMFGGAGFDTLIGSTGNDTMSGNFNADTFVFADFGGGFGQDTITDFSATNPFEKIDLRRVNSISNLNDLQTNHMTQVGSDVVIDALGGNTITLTGVNLADLDITDFIF